MDEREKIIKIIEKWAERTITTSVWGAGVHDVYNAAELADVLIAANIGDVSWWERKCKLCEEDWFLQKKQIEHYAESYKEMLQEDLDAYKHRAEVAERALELMARGECTFASPEFYKEEAEKEIAMEEQMMANRCGEGKCEYFESIRRAANNNRGNDYCKKYKRELHLYDWWWLKCDECTAEKELAEEKGE